MSVPRRTTPAGRPVRSARALAAVVLLGVPATACTTPATPSTEPETRPTSTPLSAYDGDGPALVPRDPCTGIDAATVIEALGGDVATSLTWAPGQRLPGTSEVADEYGCRYTAGDVTASAWVFAAPTSPAQARRLAADATAERCRRTSEVESFGDPGVAYACDGGAAAPSTGMRGLVGTSWVSCEIRGTDDEQRVADWCTAVLASLSAT